MNTQNRQTKSHLVLALGVAFVFFSSLSSFAQLSVVSITPADGTTDVPTEVTIQVEFSAALDTNAQFPPDYMHFLSLLISQDQVIGEPDSITVSADLKTIQYHNYKIAADAKFIFGVLAAKGQNGESLDLPAIVTFSTGATLPAGSVAGRVTFEGGNPRGSLVSLYPHLFLAFQEDLRAVAVVNQSTGEYTIPYVEEGSYYPIAGKDTSGDGFPDVIDLSEPAGFYDPNHDTVPDSLIVSEGQSVTGIDMALSVLRPFTARERFDEIKALVEAQEPTASLYYSHSQHYFPDGTASGWWFYFTISEAEQEIIVAWATSYLTIIVRGFEPPPPWGYIPLPGDWLDSKVAADSANAHGGDEFLAAHPYRHGRAELLMFEGPKVSQQGSVDKNAKLTNRKLPSANFEVKISEPRAIWVITYEGGMDDEFQIFLDALTGQPVELWPPALGEPTTARENVPVATDSAQAWAADAELIGLGTHASYLQQDGTAEMWFYAFYSTTLDSGHTVICADEQVIFEGPLDFQPPSLTPLPANWIDSDAAADTANAHGGADYLNNHPQAVADAMLFMIDFSSSSEWLFQDKGRIGDHLKNNSPTPAVKTAGLDFRAVWIITYWADASVDPLEILIDAVTGEVIELVPPQPNPTTARDNFPAVSDIAVQWANDAVPVYVGALSTVSPSGAAEGWTYIFLSPAKDSSLVFYGAGGSTIGEEIPGAPVPGLQPLPDNWIDSDVAVQAAEIVGGSQFRIDHPNHTVAASLSHSVLSSDPTRALWSLSYFEPPENMLLFNIDALTGEIITGVKEASFTEKAPLAYELKQNYPNPFNPVTTIEYAVKESGRVALKVYDIRGREVATLVDTHQRPGFYKVNFDGHNLTTGVYFYRIQMLGFVATYKMVLLE